MIRIASLSILFAALIKFAIERASFDLGSWLLRWCPCCGISWDGRYALTLTRRSTTGSPLPGDSLCPMKVSEH